MSSLSGESGASIFEVEQLANNLEGRILLIDSRFKILADTYNRNCGKYLVTKETIHAMNGEEVSYRYIGDQYLQIILPIEDKSSEKPDIRGLIIAVVSLHNCNEMSEYLYDQRDNLLGIFIIITIILSFFTLVFGELVPKRLAMKNYEKIAFGSIGVIRTISIITAPFVKFLTIVTNAVSKLFGVGESDEETVTEEEIKMMVTQGEESGNIKEEEKELINNVFEFNDITVSEIMRHRKDIFAVDINISNEELISELSKEEYRHSRIPVYDETIDEIKGILYIKDVLKNINKKTFKVKNVIKEPYFVSQNRLINEVFRELQKNKIQIAIILDEYGGTAGLVTMEDILEELVGDIYDEYDEEEKEFEKIDDNTYILSGNMTIYDVNKLLNAKIPEGDYDTISGFLQDQLGRIPEDEENPIIETETVTYKIEEYEDKRILKIKACKNNIHQIEQEDEEEGR